MSVASSLPYQLRPNKAVDRELFLSLLGRLAGLLRLEDYTYIGLGGPFLEDFRLIHSRLGIGRLISVEAEKEVHKRQLFNRPVPSVECRHSTLEDFIDAENFETPVILWFDYTSPKEVTKQIARFAESVVSVPECSILRITINADPASLGQPDKDEVRPAPNGEKSDSDKRSTLFEWRLDRFRNRLGAQCPVDVGVDEMSRTQFGRPLLRALQLAVSAELQNCPSRTVFWLLATHYSDGQIMATATLVVLGNNPEFTNYVSDLVKSWKFYSTPVDPLVLDMPVLSARERLTLEAHQGRNADMNYALPESKFGEDPVDSFKRFYRVFPHFTKVDL
jgi:hypothetical protein